MRPHRWNLGFEGEDRHERPRLLTADQVRQCDELRFFVRHRVCLGIAPDLLGPDVNLYREQAVAR